MTLCRNWPTISNRYKAKQDTTRSSRAGPAIEVLAVAVFIGLLVVVASRDVGDGLIAFVTVFLGFGGFEVLHGRQIRS
jgi:hypothetical protein